MRTLLIIFLLISCISHAQRPLVQLEVSPKEAEIGQSITITVKANVQGELEVDLPKSFESGNSTMSSMQQEIDYNTGKVVTYFIHSENGSFTRSGSYTVGPAYIRRGNKVFKSNVASISIRKEEVPTNNEQRYSYRQLSQPAFGVIQASKRSVYEGEPLLLSAKILARFSPSHLEGYQPYQAEGSGEKHDLDDESEQIALKEERIGRADYYSFSYDKQLIFPLTSGKMKVSPFEMLLMRGFESFALTSAPLTIDVKPLPKDAPNNFTGGVGTFSITQKISSSEIKRGEIITLTRTISGTGNLHLLSFPELTLPEGLELYGDPEVKEAFSFGNDGAKGKIIYTYHLKATRSGDLEIPDFSLSYFDPDKVRYVQTKATGDNLKIPSDPSIASTGNPANGRVGEESFHKADRSENRADEDTFLPNWIWIVLTALFALLSIKLFRDRRKQRTSVNLTEETQVQAKPFVQKSAEMGASDNLKFARNAIESGDSSEFFVQIEKSVLTALRRLSNNPTLNRAELLSSLRSHPKYPEISEWFADFDASRYGMGISGAEPGELLERAEKFIISAI